MKVEDYRVALGLGFENEDGFKGVIANVRMILDTFLRYESVPNSKSWAFVYFLSTSTYSVSPDMKDMFRDVWFSSDSINELIFKYVVMMNSAKTNGFLTDDQLEILNVQLQKSLKLNMIPYEIREDEDGVFYFPKGCKELDQGLINEPLSLLKGYESKTLFEAALRKYAEDKDSPSEISDGFRKALEAFMQEFFHSSRSLENLSSEYCSYLKSHGVPSEVSNNILRILDAYEKYNNAYSKHHSGASHNILEYLLYETGNVIRLLLYLQEEELDKA